MNRIEKVRKRDGRIVPFDKGKIVDAIFKAALSVGGEDRFLAEELAGVVYIFLEKNYQNRIPTIEDIQDMVEKVLIETGHAKTAKAYILYRDKRARIREALKVRKEKRNEGCSTDLSLLVDPGTREEIQEWSKGKIAAALETEANLPPEMAMEIASAVEQKVFNSGWTRINTSLIRELVDNELFERGFKTTLKKQVLIGMPKFDIEQLIYSKSQENSNITANNPEAINLAIAENTLKQYALQEIFSREVADAHLKGILHIHDLGYPTRVYCSSHSLEYLKLYGLSLRNLDTCSAPARHARTLTGHLNTFLASMQAYYAGALGVGYLNILYAPYLENMSVAELRQEAQHLVYSGSQSAFSRGGQTLFLDFNVHTGIPFYMRKSPAVGPGGKKTGKTYGEYEGVARKFCGALLDIWREGDKEGHIFAFPKCDFHINEQAFKDPEQVKLLEYACQIASENGVPYFVFDRNEVNLSACCRLRISVEDKYMLEHLESMRFCGFQNITVNLPQAGFRAGRGNWNPFFENIEEAMDLAIKAHLQKRKFIQQLMSSPSMPLWEIGKIALDGRPYVDLKTATYIIGLIGLNECVHFMMGEELHESERAFRRGLEIVAFMYFKAKEAGKRLGLRFSLEESPAESASRRLAKIDLRQFPEAERFVRGDKDKDESYYTNSVHFRADAPIDLVTRVRLQSKFHSMVESGAIIHGFVGEKTPSGPSIFTLVKKTFFNTQAAQLTISPEFTICNICQKTTQGLVNQCPYCLSQDIQGISRFESAMDRGRVLSKVVIQEFLNRHGEKVEEEFSSTAR